MTNYKETVIAHSLKSYAHHPEGGEVIELRGTKMWVKAAYEDAPGAFSIIVRLQR